MSERLSYLLLIGLGFVVLPFGTSWYEIPKVVIFWVAAFLLGISFFWQEKNWRQLKLTSAIKISLGGLFLLSLHSLVLQHHPTTFLGNVFRLQGVLTFWALLTWALIQVGAKKIRPWPSLVFAGLIGLTISAIFGPTDLAERAVGVIGEANSLGAFALFLWPLAIGVKSGVNKKLLSALILVGVIVVIFLSGSRSALLGLVIQSAYWFGSAKFGLRRAAVISVSLLLLSLGLPFLQERQLFDYRPEIWRTALEAGKERPILGWGIGNTEVGLKAAAEEIGTSLRYQYVDSSHNLFLDWWVQGGIAGLALLCSILALTIEGLIDRKEKTALVSLFGILAVSFFNPLSISLLVPLWWLIGKGQTNRR